MNAMLTILLAGLLSAQAPAPPHTATIAAGRVLTVRTAEPLSSRRSMKDDAFLAILDQRLIVDGFVIAERGARCEGRVIEAGKVKGGSQITLELTKITTTDGQTLKIHTAPFARREITSREREFGLPPQASVPFRLDQDVTITERVPVR
jgi:hypothetical protein